jgi:SAM-dependent methyltransferase
MDLLDPGGRAVDRLDATEWTAGLRPGDRALLDRCRGTTLDVGCGPGRLAAALTRGGRAALGVDICPEAVRQTRRRGAPAWHGNVFASLPLEGTWSSVLLADGNIGIGGDPHRLLRRCRRLVRSGGSVLAELRPPGSVTWSGRVRLRFGEDVSQPFPWAAVAAHDVTAVAHRAGLGVRTLWTEAGRWFAHLVC